jgi:hypothetical protein
VPKGLVETRREGDIGQLVFVIAGQSKSGAHDGVELLLIASKTTKAAWSQDQIRPLWQETRRKSESRLSRKQSPLEVGEGTNHRAGPAILSASGNRVQVRHLAGEIVNQRKDVAEWRHGALVLAVDVDANVGSTRLSTWHRHWMPTRLGSDSLVYLISARIFPSRLGMLGDIVAWLSVVLRTKVRTARMLAYRIMMCSSKRHP